MTWGELKRRIEELGVRDDEHVGRIEVDEDIFDAIEVTRTVHAYGERVYIT